MSTSYERTFRAEILKEELAEISAGFIWLKTRKAKKIGIGIGILANQLLFPDYDTDEALDEVEEKRDRYRELLTIMKKEA